MQSLPARPLYTPRARMLRRLRDQRPARKPAPRLQGYRKPSPRLQMAPGNLQCCGRGTRQPVPHAGCCVPPLRSCTQVLAPAFYALYGGW